MQLTRHIKKTNKLVSKAVRKAKITLEKNLAKNIKSNPKAFYRYMNNNTKTRFNVGPLKDDKNQLHTDDAKMVEILNTTFTSVFTAENLSNLPNPEQTNVDEAEHHAYYSQKT